MRERATTTQSSRLLIICLAAFALAALAIRAWIAAHAWFVSDDFYFLNLVQSRHWSWSEVFMPTHVRYVAGYRPLGLDGYFFWNFALFGFDASGYHATAFVVQCATAIVTARIARQLTLDLRSTVIVGLMTLFSGATLTASYTVNEHNYLCAALFYALTVTLFLDYILTLRIYRLVLSSLAFVGSVLSNEICVTAVVLLFGMSLVQRLRSPGACLGYDGVAVAVKHALGKVWPHVAITILFVDFLATGVPRGELNWFYEPDFGWDMLSNTLGNLTNVFGGLLRFVGVLVGAIALVSHVPSRRRWVGLLPAGWLLLGLLPVAVLAFPASRFALLLAPACALCIGYLSHLLTRRVAEKWRNQLLAVVACAYIPWEGTVSLISTPPGQTEHHAFLVAKEILPRRNSKCMQVLCGGEGLASPAECAQLRRRTFGGALFRAIVPHQELHVEFEDARLKMHSYYRQTLDECVQFQLSRDQRLVPIEASTEYAMLAPESQSLR